MRSFVSTFPLIKERDAVYHTLLFNDAFGHVTVQAHVSQFLMLHLSCESLAM
ncbi:UNVERIFIED_CONTAM: hypothetical protein FKN15_016275 [Acipenser sinensis]